MHITIISKIQHLWLERQEGKVFDIHSHILYSTDDGAACIEESVKMLVQAAENGIEGIIATPHYIEGLYVSSYEDNLGKLDRLKREIVKAGIDMHIYLGNELLITPEIIRLVRDRKAAVLNESRYILIELPFFDLPPYTEKVLFQLELEGYKPILAHPERNVEIVNDLNILYRLIKQGVLVQMNLASLKGAYGKHVKKAALLMLEHSMVHFAGTDMHSPRTLQVNFTDSMEKLKAYYPEQLNRLLYDNPLRIIRNESIVIPEPVKIKNRNFKKLIFGL